MLLAGLVSACKRNHPQTTAAPPSQLKPPPPPPPVIAQIHFAGADNISGDTNSLAFTNEFASAEARALESQTLDKLSRAPGAWFKNKLPPGTPDGSALLRPLLDDCLKSEWFFEIRDTPASPEYTLAIRLDAGRPALWQTNLRTLLESWTKIAATNITNGWELKKDLPPNLFRIVRAGDWIVIGYGQDELPLSDEWAGGNIPQNAPGWFDANLDWPRLARTFPLLAKFDLPALQMLVSGHDGNLFLNGKCELSQPLPALEKWQIPTNMIHEPVASFTAARGFAPWLERQSWVKWLQISPEPDQLFVWSLGVASGKHEPSTFNPGYLQTFIAVPVASATNALAQLGENLSSNTNWQKHLQSSIKFQKSPERIDLAGAPFAAPEVKALRSNTGDFLFAGVFPNLPFGRPPPPQLYQQLVPTNLVYYHWEITPERLKSLPALTQLALLLTSHRQLDAGSAAYKWLSLITPDLGSSVTKMMQTGPSELSFERQAPGGLTAVELVALANWLEAPNFPGCDLSLPPQWIPETQPEPGPVPLPQPHPPKRLSSSVTNPPPPAAR